MYKSNGNFMVKNDHITYSKAVYKESFLGLSNLQI